MDLRVWTIFNTIKKKQLSKVIWMAIVGFEFSKIEVSKKDVASGNINIGNNIAITDVVKNDLKIGGNKQAGAKFLFEYKSTYEPDYAKIILGGSIMYLTDEKSAADLIEEWKGKKKIKKEIAEAIVNSILTKCNIQSILLANTVNLPPPVPMPKVNISHKAPAGAPAKKEEDKEAKPAKQEKLKKS